MLKINFMQETILIQTDFRPESLILVKTAIQNNLKAKLDIVLVHGVHMTDSITELLFYSRHKMLQKVSNDLFTTGLNELRETFAANINSLRVELFTGLNQAAFNNFLEANRISQIFVAPDYVFANRSKYSRDLAHFINKSVSRKVEISWSMPSEPFARLALTR